MESQGELDINSLFLNDPDYQLTEKQYRLHFESGGLEVRILAAADFLQMVNARAYLRVWPSAAALATYLVNSVDFSRLDRVVELGAGTGFCSLALQKYLAERSARQEQPPIEIVVTDGDTDVMDLIAQNSALNCGEDSGGVALRVHRYEWGNAAQTAQLLQGTEQPQHRFALIYGSDITYKSESIGLLLESAAQLLRNDAHSLFVLSYSFPRFAQQEKLILEAAAKQGLVHEIVATPTYLDPLTTTLVSDGVKIMLLRIDPARLQP